MKLLNQLKKFIFLFFNKKSLKYSTAVLLPFSCVPPFPLIFFFTENVLQRRYLCCTYVVLISMGRPNGNIEMFIQTSMKINHLCPRIYNKKYTTICIEIKKYLKFIVFCLLHIFLHFLYYFIIFTFILVKDNYIVY